MFVDTALLRMGADYSQSAGAIVQRGAQKLASSSLPDGIFGDFESAQDFQNALRRARDSHVASMQAHQTRFDALAVDANTAARIFVHEDEASSSALDAAARNLA